MLLANCLKLKRCHWGTAIMFLILFSACSRSRPSRFYLLDSTGDGKAVRKKNTGAETISVRIDKIRIADYLKRPQIAVRLSENELEYNEFQRWAEPLDLNIADFVHRNLSKKLPDNVVLLPEYNAGKDIDYTIEISIRQLDIYKDMGVTMLVETSIFRENTPLPAITHFKSYQSDTTQNSMDGYVKDISRLFSDYCTDLSEEIGRL